MKLKKFMGIIAAVSIIASAGSVGASAAEELPIGYVTVSVEKFTLGQGFILEPVKVPYFEGETGADITDRALGSENINYGQRNRKLYFKYRGRRIRHREHTAVYNRRGYLKGP